MTLTTTGDRRRSRLASSTWLAGAVAVTLLASIVGVFTAPAAQAEPPGDKDVTAVMFQWTWDAVARECTSTLGPAGYGYVQVSPPAEHVQGSQWWTSYQPVSYQLESKLGTRGEFATMVSTCHDAGVEVMVDTVINHMSGKPEGGTGFAGSPFSYYDYPGTYQDQDFSSCRRDIYDSDYKNDAWAVQNCNLVKLADLATGTTYVRSRIAQYLNDLISLGVRGFRIDAAKHMPTADIAAIRSRLSDPDVYIVQEVIGSAGEVIKDTDYVGNGEVQEFDYARNTKRIFTGERLAYLKTFGESWGMMPSAQAGVFVDNHDTERNGESLNQTYGSTYTLANVFMLAWPYGSPSVHSGYSFTDRDAGAPQNADGTVKDAVCFADGWRCQHAWREIANMVGFRNAVDDAAMVQWWDNGNNQIAFGRGDRGYVVINKEGGTLTREFTTSLPAGRYCDVISGQPTATGCTGAVVEVGAYGRFTASVGPNNALALHVEARAGSGGGDTGLAFAVNATTVWGQSISAVGDRPELGSWSPASGVALSAATYPIWRDEVLLPAGTRVEYKYVRIEANGSATWESGTNRVVTVPASGLLTLNDTWRS
jgi:alpha-amylase